MDEQVKEMVKRLRDMTGWLHTDAAADLLEQQQAVLDRLPKTADGVPVVPGDVVYHPCGSYALLPGCVGQGALLTLYNGCDVVLGGCYSSKAAAREAAEQAKGGGE
jgi:hypothetical protein